MGCTTGAKILNDGHNIVVFKNKDFKVESYSDGLSMEHSHAFGVRGVNLKIQKMTGFSIGVNQYGLVAVNSNVLSTFDQLYDLITERIVLEARTVNDAIEICEQENQGSTKYQWCNMIIATPKQLAAIELTSSDLATAQSNDYLVRTNHHLILKTNETIMDSSPNIGHQQIKNSEIRYNTANNMLKKASEVQEVVSLLKKHHQKASICRHGRTAIPDLSFKTVYSYLVIIKMEKHPRIIFNVVKGPPCIQSYTSIEMKFPSTEERQKQIRTNYPF